MQYHGEYGTPRIGSKPVHGGITVFQDLVSALQSCRLEKPTGAIPQRENAGIMSLLNNPLLKWDSHQQACDFSRGLLTRIILNTLKKVYNLCVKIIDRFDIRGRFCK